VHAARAQKEKRHSSQRAKQICMIIGRLRSKGVRCRPAGRPVSVCYLCVSAPPHLHPTAPSPLMFSLLLLSLLHLMHRRAAPLSARFNPAHLPLSHPISSSSIILELIFKILCDLPTTNNNIYTMGAVMLMGHF
jgi:hypothetical protein